MGSSGIDVMQIPEVEIRNLSITFLAAAMRYFDDPEHSDAFEAWERSRKVQKE